jgi:glycine/D-amino acid oxidase-like deaminating enzyme
VYGSRAIYTKMAARALKLWAENEARWKRKLYTRTGVLWMIVTTNDEFETAALPLLKEQNLSYEKLSTDGAAKRFPQVNFDGVRWVLLENEGGYLLARQACHTVMESVAAEGGAYKQVSAQPGEIRDGSMSQLKLSDGSALKADLYLFACGPWLPKLFPDILEKLITPTRQEVFYFGTPAGDNQFNEERLPVWANHADALFYGIPGNQWRGLKVADDTHGPVFDPTAGERKLSEQNLTAARKMLEYRFPDMKGAPLLESRVCQYENSPDSHFIIDRHPAAENVWFLGGGSGHGFKFGPALGEYVSRIIMGSQQPDPLFQLKRFENA